MTSWMRKLEKQVRGFELYEPMDPNNPAKGQYTIVGPTTEFRPSHKSFDHAALLYLAQVCRDRDAIQALNELITTGHKT